MWTIYWSIDMHLWSHHENGKKSIFSSFIQELLCKEPAGETSESFSFSMNLTTLTGAKISFLSQCRFALWKAASVCEPSRTRIKDFSAQFNKVANKLGLGRLSYHFSSKGLPADFKKFPLCAFTILTENDISKVEEKRIFN